jgi:hypothetical protein
MEETKSTQTRRARHGAVARMYTVEEAAPLLSLEPSALRARCRRAARRIGNEVIAHLGGGVVAFKFGRSWRVQFPEP